MKVLHITNWFPSQENSKRALWVKRQIDSISNYAENIILHFEIIPNSKFRVIKSRECQLNQLIIKTPVKRWFIIELFYLIWLFHQLIIKGKHKKFDVINFHIAYPMLTYWHLIKKYVNKPVIINEHWSAYHFNFGMEKNLPRIQRIFKQKLPVITVSKALSKDIKQFANADFPNYIVPNIVDEKDFFIDKSVQREKFFFMVSQWKYPKKPLTVMEAFLKTEISNEYELIIGGYGPLWSQMNNFVQDKGVNNKIKLIGSLESYEIADCMRKCTAYLHPSDYETFSVVCAEAKACGAIVFADNVGGVPEVLSNEDILIEKSDIETWTKVLDNVKLYSKNRIDPNGYTSKKVGKIYFKVLKSLSIE